MVWLRDDPIRGGLVRGRLGAARGPRDTIVYPKDNGREGYRIAYATGGDKRRPAAFYDRLFRLDLKARKATVWHEPGAFPGEPVFLPRPGATDPQDGASIVSVLPVPVGMTTVAGAVDILQCARMP